LVLKKRYATFSLSIIRVGFGALSLGALLIYLPHFSYSFGEASAWASPLKDTSSVNNFWAPIQIFFQRADSDTLLLVKVGVLLLVNVLFILGWRTRIIA